MAARQEVIPVNRWVLLFVVMVGTFMAVLDSTIMNVSLPAIITYFGSDVERVKWVSTGFMIAAAVAMPLTGWLGRRFGYGTVYLFALGGFVVGAAASASAWSLNALIAGRLLQGVGAGIVQPTSIALLTRTFPPQIRGRVFGIWAIGVMTAPSLGPTVGGFLMEVFSWRAVFTMSALVGVLALLFAMAVLQRGTEEEAAAFDFSGYFSLAGFMISALLTVSNGQELGWDSAPILAGGTVAGGFLLAFLTIESAAEHPIVPLRLFRIPDFSLAMFLTLYRSVGLFGSIFLMPVFLYQVQGHDTFAVGLIMMPGAVVMALFSPLAGAITDRFGGRWPAVVGTVLMAQSLFSYRTIDPLTSLWEILYPTFVRGLGIALVMTPVVTTGINAVPREDAGNASWMLNLAQRAGGAFAISILSSLLHRETMVQQMGLGGARLATLHPPAELVRRALALGMTPPEAAVVIRGLFARYLSRAALTLAFQNLFVLSAAVTLTAAVPAFCLNLFRPPRPVGEAVARAA